MKTIRSLAELFEAVRRRGFRLVGPTVREQTIVYDELDSAEDLPVGWTDEQESGSYRLQRRDDGAYFGYVVGPHSWKKYLFPPTLRLWSGKRTSDGFEVEQTGEPSQPTAFIGVRSCELHAIAIQDRVFTQSDFVDPTYQERREKIFTIAVNCALAGNTCFCVSMDTGPKAAGGFDLALTEVIDGDNHYFTVETGSAAGDSVIAEVTHEEADGKERAAADAVVAKAAAQMKRELDTVGLKELLQDNYNHPQWEEVAQRCLACGNCTMVCPTCFCSTVEDVTSLDGSSMERVRKWDSCFTQGFSYIHGGTIRASTSSRYRQWMTHKLANWIDQFGTAGCVGCGRCITWCPVGIDITVEAAEIRASMVETAEDR